MNSTVDACWRSIGVYGGDLSCPTLAEVLHCRNCPRFHQAARSLLDRDDPSPLQALPDSPAVRPVDERSALAFRLGAQWFALPAARLTELAEDRPLRRLAHRVGGRLQGLVNIRGELQLCVALGELLQLTADGEAADSPRLVLFRGSGDDVLAFRVDQVRGLLQYRPEQVQPPPATLPAVLARCVAGIVVNDDQRLALIDGDGLAALLDEALYT